MGGYRDDLGAAVARADALQQEVNELKQELARLRSDRATTPAPAPRARGVLGAYAALGAMILFVAAMVLLVVGWVIPQPPPPSVYVEFERPR